MAICRCYLSIHVNDFEKVFRGEEKYMYPRCLGDSLLTITYGLITVHEATFPRRIHVVSIKFSLLITLINLWVLLS